MFLTKQLKNIFKKAIVLASCFGMFLAPAQEAVQNALPHNHHHQHIHNAYENETCVYLSNAECNENSSTYIPVRTQLLKCAALEIEIHYDASLF